MIRTCSVLIVAIAMMLMASTVFGQPPTADHPRLLPRTCDGYRIQALDLAPVSRNLSQVATIGLQALDDLKHNQPVNADVRNRNIDFLNAAAKPQAVLLLMVAPSVETLVKATRTN